VAACWLLQDSLKKGCCRSTSELIGKIQLKVKKQLARWVLARAISQLVSIRGTATKVRDGAVVVALLGWSHPQLELDDKTVMTCESGGSVVRIDRLGVVIRVSFYTLPNIPKHLFEMVGVQTLS
jgi:hypothetical protein